MERTGSKSRSIPFTNPAAAARALPATLFLFSVLDIFSTNSYLT